MESVPSPGSSHNGSNLQVHTYETIPKGEGSEGLGPSGTTSVEVFQLRRSGTREPGWGGFCMGHAECHGDKIPLKLMFSDPNRSSWTVLYFTCVARRNPTRSSLSRVLWRERSALRTVPVSLGRQGSMTPKQDWFNQQNWGEAL